MKFLVWLLNSILLSSIFALCFTFAMQRTVFSPDYLRDKIQRSGLTVQLSDILPGLLAQQAGKDVPKEDIQRAVKDVLTPQLLQTKVNQAADQFNNYLAKNGALPQLDLKDVAQAAAANGIDIPPEAVAKPIVLPATTGNQMKLVYQKTAQAQMISLLVTLVLFLIIFMICYRTHDYGALTYLFVMSGLMQLLLYLTMKYAPDLVVRFIPTTDPAMQPLVQAFEKFAWSVLADIGWWFAIFAIVFFVLGGVTFVLSLISRTRHKSATA